MLETLPDELEGPFEDLTILIEDIADEVLEQELELDDPFELMALYKSGEELSPGVMRKQAPDKDVLMLFRRSILDVWCETGDPLPVVLRDVMIAELGRHSDFSEDEIDEMAGRHYQGMFG